MQQLAAESSTQTDGIATEPVERSSHRIPELDGVRGLAILMVLAWHYFSCLLGPLERGSVVFYLSRMCTLTWSGVDLFFVLSGSLIGGILLDHAGKSGFAKTFLLRRLFRIVPAYILLLTTFLLATSKLDSSRNEWLLAGTMPFVSYCVMLQNLFMAAHETFGCNALAITWSLAVEEQFYCFVVVLFVLAQQKTAASALLLLGVFAPVLRMLIPGFHAYVLLPFRLDAFALGFSVALTMRSPSLQKWCRDHSTSVCLCASILLLGVGAATWRGGMGQFEHTYLAVFYAVFVLLAVLHSGSFFTGPLRSRFLKTMGCYSYGIYLFHQFILGYMHASILGEAPSHDSPTAAVVTSISLLLTFILAAVSFHFFESPFISMSRRFGYGTSSK